MSNKHTVKSYEEELRYLIDSVIKMGSLTESQLVDSMDAVIKVDKDSIDKIIKSDEEINSASVFPLAFPLIAGAGTLTTILSIKAEYHVVNIIIGIIINLIIVFLVIRSSDWIQRKIGKNGEEILRKVFGIILLAISIKLIQSNLSILSHID